MLAFLALLPAHALDLEVSYSAQPVGYTRTWTFHDVDAEDPPVVIVPCPGGEECRMGLVVEPLEEGGIAIYLDLEGEFVRQIGPAWTRPRLDLKVGEVSNFYVGSREREMKFTASLLDPENPLHRESGKAAKR